MTIIRGIVREGKGEARAFTRLGWVRQQFRDKLGFDPFPGTLNLQVKDGTARAALRAPPAIVIEPAPGYCMAKCFRVKLNGKISAAWIVPDVPGYPENQIELIAPVSLRDVLGLKDGDAIQIEVEGAV